MDEIVRRFNIETNSVNSEKRKYKNSDMNKQSIKNLGEETQGTVWRDGQPVSKDPPLEELGLVKTHQDQEVSLQHWCFIGYLAGWLM